VRLVIPSVQYGDFLAVTLPAWRALLPEAYITVVTTADDTETLRVAAAHHVRGLATDAWTRAVEVMNHDQSGGPVFNKALALDEAFGFVPGRTEPPALREHCLAVDADVVPFGTWPTAPARPGVLYGCPRYACDSPAQLAALQAGQVQPADLRLIPPKVRGDQYETKTRLTAAQCAEKCLGYFQLFRYRPGLRFGSYRTAGRYDLDFRRHFTERAAVTGLVVAHLGVTDRKNWSGRVVPPWVA
jgi:hypothetical protein